MHAAHAFNQIASDKRCAPCAKVTDDVIAFVAGDARQALCITRRAQMATPSVTADGVVTLSLEQSLRTYRLEQTPGLL